jgi:hypothetical protein
MPDEAIFPLHLIDQTALTPKTLRYGVARLAATIDAVVLHQTADGRASVAANFINTVAHFVVMANGQIVQLHPVESLLYASSKLSERSVSIEFGGHFAMKKNYWWSGNPARNVPSMAQIQGGRNLVTYLNRFYNIRFVFAHRQGYVPRNGIPLTGKHDPSKNERSNCPGPEIWYGVGEWAMKQLGMSDGGATFAVGNGDPIPAYWRSPLF